MNQLHISYKEMGWEVLERLREPPRVPLAVTTERERSGLEVQFKSHLFMWVKKKPTIHEEAPTSSLDSRGTDRGTDIPSRDAETVKERE